MMRALRRFLIRLLNFATRRRDHERLREEIESHIAIMAEENVRAGMTAVEAHRQACLKLGPLEAVREDYISEKGLPLVEILIMDVRYAIRVLRKSPAFTTAVVLTLMLGIGANVVVFGVLNAVLLHPLEVSDPQNLYQVRLKPWMSGRLLTTSYPAFEDFQNRNTTFSGMAAINAYSSAAMSRPGGPLREVHGIEVTGNYFDLLGVQPELGRVFHGSDEHGPGSAPFLVLSDELWRTAFDANSGVVGTIVELNQHPFTVVGVAQARFHGTERFAWPEYWVPIMNEVQAEGGYDYLHNRSAPAVTIIGRLKPGVTPQWATENLNAIDAQLAKDYPTTDRGLAVRLIRPGLYGDEGDVIRGFLFSVTFLGLLVLAAACANLSSLFAARTADRGRELALRVALGSTRRRLFRQLLTEAVIVSLLGGAAGVATADLLLHALNRWHPSFGHLVISVDARVYIIGLALALGSALLFGLIPAWQASQSSPLQAIKNGPIESPHLRRFALRDVLLCAQIAICTVLVASSLMAARGMVRALHVPLGIRPTGVMLADMDLGQLGQGGSVALEKQKEMIDAVRNIPGVTAVGTVNTPPMGGGARGIPIFRIGTTEFTFSNSALATRRYVISPGYLEAAGTRLLDGRDVSWNDTANTPRVAIVNETFARTMWGETPAMGQRFILWGGPVEVIGVAEDGKYHDLTESPEPAVYRPSSQEDFGEVVFVVRSQRAPNEIASALQNTLGGIEPNAPISIESWPDALSGVLFPARAATVALGVMGLLAAMLAVTGIFGMAAYGVSRRMKELGIRVALGASKIQVMRAAVGRPMILLGAGSALGLLAGMAARPLLTQIVYQADPSDLAIVGSAVLTMALLGIAASAIPAVRALAIDPCQLMRDE
jgi:predicted permease